MATIDARVAATRRGIRLADSMSALAECDVRVAWLGQPVSMTGRWMQPFAQAVAQVC